MNRKQANILEQFLTDQSIKADCTSYYLNTLNNDENFASQIDKVKTNVLVRDQHNYCNITVIDYLDYGNGFKGFDSRRYYYVICNNDTNLNVQIRKDLVDAWARDNAKDHVLVINEAGLVWDIPMVNFYGMSHLEYTRKMNSESNIVNTYVLEEPTYTAHLDVEPKPETVEYILKSWQYIGNVSYATHRTGKKISVTQYDNDGNRKTPVIFKSVAQVYDLCHFENYGSLRTFQRLLKNPDMAATFLTNVEGKVFYVSMLLGLLPPETTAEMEEGIVEESVAVNTEDLAAIALAMSTGESVDTSNMAKVESVVIDNRQVEDEDLTEFNQNKKVVEILNSHKIISRITNTSHSINDLMDSFEPKKIEINLDDLPF